jgi:hypothetical protein
MADQGRWTSNGGDPSLNEINRVDRFIEALSSNQQVYSTDPGEAELAFLFADWRDGVRETPVSALVTEEEAVRALRAGQPSTRRLGRAHLAVVGSAAAAVLCLGGFGAAVYGAAPGDGLYGVRSMLFGDQQATRDDQVVLAAQTELAQVQQLVEQGQWEQAQDKLVALSTTVQSVEQVESKQDLIEQWNALTYKVVEQDPAATLPPVGDPLPVLPDSPLTLLPIPVVVDTTSPTSPSDASVPSDTSLPTDTPGPEVMLTPPDSSLPQTPDSSVPTTSPAETSTPPSSSPTTQTSTPPSSTTSSAPTSTSTSAPSTTTSTTTTTAATTTTATTTTATTTTPTTTTTIATTTTQPPVEAPAPAAQSPASQTRVAPSQAAEPATKEPATTSTSTKREESARANDESDTPVTTTVVAPGGGE